MFGNSDGERQYGDLQLTEEGKRKRAEMAAEDEAAALAQLARGQRDRALWPAPAPQAAPQPPTAAEAAAALSLALANVLEVVEALEETLVDALAALRVDPRASNPDPLQSYIDGFLPRSQLDEPAATDDTTAVRGGQPQS